MRRRGKVAAIAAGGVVVCGAALAGSTLGTQAGCTLQETCSPSTVYVTPDGRLPSGVATAPYVTGQAFQPDAGIYQTGQGLLWQSSSQDGLWMDFPGQRSYVIYPLLPDGGPFVGPYLLNASVSADQNPGSNPNSNWAPSAGNITEFSNLPDGGNTGFIVTNDTCTEYFLFVTATQDYATAAPSADAAATTDAPTGG